MKVEVLPAVAIFSVSCLGLAGVGAVAYGGVSAYNGITSDKQEVSPYKDVSAKSSKGAEAVTALASASFKDGWALSKDQKNSHPSFLPCLPDGHLGSLLTTRRGGVGQESVVAQLYAPGQAPLGLKLYREAFNECGAPFEETKLDENVRALTLKGGAILLSGDVLLLIQSADVQTAVSFYHPLLVSTLTDSSCASLPVSDRDYQRTFYYSADSYTGLILSSSESSTVNPLPSPSTNFTYNGETVNTAPEPESPLPSGFPTAPPASELPALTGSVELRSSYLVDADFQAADSIGPGCGWAWTGFVQPVEDLNSLKESEARAKASAVDRANTSAVSAYNDATLWAQQQLFTLPTVFEYRETVKSANSVYDKWREFEQKREQFYPTWTAYVDDLTRWVGEAESYVKDLDAYTVARADCDADHEVYLKWLKEKDEDKSGISSSKPRDCATYPTKPTLRTQPTRPTPPTDITVPTSWVNIASPVETEAKEAADGVKKLEEQLKRKAAETAQSSTVDRPQSAE